MIPEYDRDRTHSTDHYRATAERCYPDFRYPVPESVDVGILPTSALLPLA